MKPYVINFKPGNKILELGGGDKKVPDTTNVDIRELPNVDVKWDLNEVPYPFEDNSFDGIVGIYILEHLKWPSIKGAISEIYRILKQNGKAVFLIPNTYKQCKLVANGWDDKFSCMLFGAQDYNSNAHACGFSPESVKQLFQDAGFTSVKVIHPMPDIFVGDMMAYPTCVTDMVVECHKIQQDELFERSYFDGDGVGYTGEGYRQFATSFSVSQVLLNSKPPIQSVLDVGGARGYLARILENNGIKSTVLDISKHCRDTRVIENYILWDATKTPWVKKEGAGSGEGSLLVGDKEFDLIFSLNFLEHIPENKIDDVIREMARVSNRGMHGIHMTDAPFEENVEDTDITHRTNKPKSWWEEKFKTLVPEYKVVVEHPRLLEYERPEQQPPSSLAPGMHMADGKVIPDDGLLKLNLGCFKDCFYFGWVNIDIIDLKQFSDEQQYVFLQHDVTTGLPYGDNEADIISSSHLLEHLTREQGEALLKECHRVLKPNSFFRISIPDTKTITQKYLDGNISEYKYINIGVEKANDDAEAFHSLLMSNHLTLFDESSLLGLLEKVGFKEIKRVSPFKSRSEVVQKQTISTHPSISCIIEATK